MRESKVEKDFVKDAKAAGWSCYKFSSPAQRGVPDRIFFRRGVTFLAEFKAPGRKPTKQQLHHIGILRDQWFEVFVIDNNVYGREVLKIMETMSL